MRGNGSDDGRGIPVDGSIVDLSLVGSGSTSVTHTVAVWYDDDPATVIYSSETGEYQLDGNNVAYEGDFLGVGGLDSGQSVGTGVLEATCP